MSMHLPFEDPLYLANYVYAALLSLELFLMHKKKSFAVDYVDLLKNGFDDELRALLKKFVGIDINDSKLMIKKCMRIRSEKLEELRALYEFN